MPLNRLIPLALVAFLGATGSLQAAPSSLSLKWSQLGGIVAGQHVIVDLTDKSHVEGVVTSVEPKALALEVTAKSHPTYKKGMMAAIPREDVTGLHLIHMRIRGRIIGTSLGVVVGAVGGLLVDGAGGGICFNLLGGPCPPVNHAAQVGAAAVAVGVPVAAYYLGKHSDRQKIPILLLPEN